MKQRRDFLVALSLAAAVALCMAADLVGCSETLRMDRKEAAMPQVSTPPPPKGAIVLFDGTSLEAWKTQQGQPVRWQREDGCMTVNGTGNIFTRQEFGDCRLHVEFQCPPAAATDIFSGNSGVYLCGRYEVQIMNTAGMIPPTTQACGSVYAVKPPTPSAALPAGEWQSFDIDFTAPRLAADGKLLRKPRISVVHNGIRVQDDVEIPLVQTGSGISNTYAERGPIYLQDHGNPVRFRNIWIIPKGQGATR